MADPIRFGSFELDLESADLRRNGRAFRLPEQQFQILQMLVLRQGRVVSREEIRKQLWPNDTVVEFDRSINTAIMKLRSTLGDNADKPRFIETLARRGYRFLVPVEMTGHEPPVPRPAQLLYGALVGQRVSHYRVLGLLGGGGMGLVYRGEDLKLNRPVALKFLPEEVALDAGALQRFEREARTASALNHPNICTIYQVEEHDGYPFIVMELLEGQTLRERISPRADSPSQRERLLPLEQQLSIAIQIAEGLEGAHKKGIIHRDIKPANIFLTTAGQIKILDFGLAKIASTELAGEPPVDLQSEGHPDQSAIVDLSLTGITPGTAGYMSPEQLNGERVDTRTDLFSLGLILFEMATGQRAFSGDTAPVLKDAILHQAPPPARLLNPALPAAYEKIIAKALEKDRELRYQTAAEMSASLTHLQARLRSNQTYPQRKLLYGLILFLICLAVSLGWVWSTAKRLSAPRLPSERQLTHHAPEDRTLGTC